MDDKLSSDQCARSLKALADPERLKIIQCLRGGERNVSELTEQLGSDIANVSHHLGVLRHAGLVIDRKEGKYVFYSLCPAIFKPGADGRPAGVVELGCCRLDITNEP